MSYGFLAVNNNNQILVSDQTRNLHFIGKASLISSAGHSYYGGVCVFTYQIGSLVPVVPFFTMPTADFYAITAVRQSTAGVYQIEVIRTGVQLNTNIPEVYVFADPRASSAAEGVGLVVYADDGTPSFDSRLKPLTVLAGLEVTSPTPPRTQPVPPLSAQYCSSSDPSAFTPNNFVQISAPPYADKEIYCYFSKAQGQLEVMFSASEWECDGFDIYGNCVGAGRYYYWHSKYWSFYRSAIKRNISLPQTPGSSSASGSTANQTGSIDVGWAAVSYGCNWQYLKESDVLGIGVGGDSGYGGTWPYSNEYLNTGSSTVLIGNGARYD